ncbi:MAG: hypothetical protein N0E44_18840 [Candidatus Thiodiazotropha lotti]|nr:hypothetical protein [Candidatus Thiodiazotropha lotti]MCW4221942.1 hypothetical protein [Candidatus Thiodiazotropha lotti]
MNIIRLICSGPNAKANWKWLYRRIRIARREADKAMLDCMLYGSGFIQFRSYGHPEHIPFRDIKIMVEDKDQESVR